MNLNHKNEPHDDTIVYVAKTCVIPSGKNAGKFRSRVSGKPTVFHFVDKCKGNDSYIPIRFGVAKQLQMRACDKPKCGGTGKRKKETPPAIRVLALEKYEDGQKVADIARELKVNYSAVKKWVKLSFQHNQDEASHRRARKSPPVISEQMLNTIKNWYLEIFNSTMTYKEMAARLLNDFDVKVSESTISRALTASNWSYKVTRTRSRVVFSKRVISQRREWCRWAIDNNIYFPDGKTFFLDESSVRFFFLLLFFFPLFTFRLPLSFSFFFFCLCNDQCCSCFSFQCSTFPII